jgi:hypothetical protein
VFLPNKSHPSVAMNVSIFHFIHLLISESLCHVWMYGDPIHSYASKLEMAMANGDSIPDFPRGIPLLGYGMGLI